MFKLEIFQGEYINYRVHMALLNVTRVKIYNELPK